MKNTDNLNNFCKRGKWNKQKMERWQSGRMRYLGKDVCGQTYRGLKQSGRLFKKVA